MMMTCAFCHRFIYFYSSLSSINVSGLGGCSSQFHEEMLPRSCDFQCDHCTGCEGALAAVHSADEHVVEAGYQHDRAHCCLFDYTQYEAIVFHLPLQH